MPNGLIGKITDLVGGGLFEGAEKIIDQFVDDPQEVAEAKRMLLEEERRIHQAILQHQETLFEEQSKIIQSEAHSSHWAAANVRPLTIFSFVAVALYAGIFAPIFGFPAPMLNEVPGKAWDVIFMGLGGYIGARSAEKIVPDAVREWARSRKKDSDG